MTRRRRRGGHPVVWLAVLVLVVLVLTAARYLPLLVLAGVIAYGCRRWHWHRHVRAALTQTQTGPAEHPEVTRLRAENDQLRAALADAEAARDAAWDAAASVPPRPVAEPGSDQLDDLLSAPFSGARRLGS